MYIRLPWESEVKKLLVSRKLGVGFGNGYWGWVKKFEELETGVKKILGLGGGGGGGVPGSIFGGPILEFNFRKTVKLQLSRLTVSLKPLGHPRYTYRELYL